MRRTEEKATNFNKWDLLYKILALVAPTTFFLLALSRWDAPMQPRSEVYKARAEPDPLDKDTMILVRDDENLLCSDTSYESVYFADSKNTSNIYKIVFTGDFIEYCHTDVTTSFYDPMLNTAEQIASGVLCNGSLPLLPINSTGDWSSIWSNVTLRQGTGYCKAAVLYVGPGGTSNPQFPECAKENFYQDCQEFEKSEQDCAHNRYLALIVVGAVLAGMGVFLYCVHRFIHRDRESQDRALRLMHMELDAPLLLGNNSSQSPSDSGVVPHLGSLTS
jgi:hypothetical protein